MLFKLTFSICRDVSSVASFVTVFVQSWHISRSIKPIGYATVPNTKYPLNRLYLSELQTIFKSTAKRFSAVWSVVAATRPVASSVWMHTKPLKMCSDTMIYENCKIRNVPFVNLVYVRSRSEAFCNWNLNLPKTALRFSSAGSSLHAFPQQSTHQKDFSRILEEACIQCLRRCPQATLLSSWFAAAPTHRWYKIV